MKKSVIGAAALALLVAAVLIWWLSQNGKDANAIVLHGNVDVRQVSLAFEGSGRVEALKVEEGDRIKAGDLLAVLDTQTLALEADQAVARVAADRQTVLRMQNGSRPEEIQQARDSLAAAQADAVRAAADLTRMKNVAAATDGRGVSGQEIDRAASIAKASKAQARQAQEALTLALKGPRAEDVAAAQAQLKGSEAAVALIRHRIAQGELRAPEDAVVRSRLLEVGDMASPQRPVYELALTSPKWIRVYVNEADLGRVKPGMDAQVMTDSAPDKPVPGKVGYISSVAEFTPKSVETEDLRTALVYEVRVLVDDKTGLLRLGQPVTVTLKLGAAQ
ncbi:HlyD family efflux transporter periplasmic adaptor subunit [Novosphingobium mangrovi (ex Huang et al. 2023)]|uniref:HlyD family efflux transporter periplasmic adaptor subunit n=1 Tax=Novosphingobium mangrovi (ex Huang et al. 2023) TaxID=2976432 RepID=A0ABT2I420_9SPHN|nr:HlyD family efflux transporter periplasmic adaptor subunit [Novosphingobium mangrovi (ex Huang et al. 2023)]MCT2399561.1 HlyD family efflux transporter periplasmic adaptor subunit [Novosphingobium mangrovi (ex Huang et al. 2023)]